MACRSQLTEMHWHNTPLRRRLERLERVLLPRAEILVVTDWEGEVIWRSDQPEGLQRTDVEARRGDSGQVHN